MNNELFIAAMLREARELAEHHPSKDCRAFAGQVEELHRAAQQEIESLRQRLAECERERDQQIKECNEFWGKKSDADYGEIQKLHGQLATVTKERDELVAALNAMLTHMGMDEDEWNRVTFNQARAALAKLGADKTGETEAEKCYKNCNDYACVRNGHCMGSAGK